MDDLKFDSLKLEHQLCFPLYAASREIIKQYKPFLDRLDLTYTQYIAMMLLWEHKTMTAKEMGERLYLDSGTLTPLLKKMESKGLLARCRSVTDERNLQVSVTEKGMQLRLQATDIPAKIASCSRLDPQEALLLYRILYKILEGPRGSTAQPPT